MGRDPKGAKVGCGTALIGFDWVWLGLIGFGCGQFPFLKGKKKRVLTLHDSKLNSIISLQDMIGSGRAFLFLWKKSERCGINLGQDFMIKKKKKR